MLRTKLLLFILPFMLGSTPAPESADTPPSVPKPSTAVLMAQMCVSEISWQKDPLECQLMMEVNYRNAKRNGINVETQTRKFNAYFKAPNKRRPWIQYLNEEGTKPHYWPSKAASWEVHKKYWKIYLDAAKKFPRRFKHKWYPALCARADDYGGRCDDNGLHACDTPKQGKCARLIRCLRKPTHQAYWNLECCRNRQKCNDNFL